MFDSNKYRLSNGVELISIKKETQIFSIHAGVKVGSLFETKSEKGISHFVEHMLFKGTINRTNEKLNNDLEALGGEYNAYTDHNCTVYSVTALKEEFNNSIEILSDMIKQSIFPEVELEKERGVILAEIRTSKDDIEDYSFRRINEVAFKSSPLKYDILGTEKHVKKFNREDLLNFYNTYYNANNCCITIVSPYEHEYVREVIENYFGDWREEKIPSKDNIVEKNIEGTFISHKKDIEQSTILYLYTFHGLDKKEELALRVLNHKLGDSTNSILFRKLREEKGLVYDVYTSLDTTNYVKTLYIYTSVEEDKLKESIEVIESCIEDINKRNIVFDDSTIELMKKALKTGVVFTLEDPTDLSNYVLHQMIDGDNIYAFIEDMEQLENIKKENIYDIGEKVLNHPTIHILQKEG
ncbi:insulinase family protein [Clostridium sp. MSJ-11]|uniref:Insulinase family protein n=1 Tax=Clostridium mobile TaxID=2841512 RepID=A0ABS6EJL3_9CLOT|nr:pitrilysin family protein [Clostridium mobile]MBU5485418.1 insulinase family protein [Clostridium mobile]